MIRVFSRQGCHLCEELIEQLIPMIRGKTRLEVVDIDEDPQLVERYGIRVPVVVDETETELSEYPLNTAALQAYLRSL